MVQYGLLSICFRLVRSVSDFKNTYVGIIVLGILSSLLATYIWTRVHDEPPAQHLTIPAQTLPPQQQVPPQTDIGPLRNNKPPSPATTIATVPALSDIAIDRWVLQFISASEGPSTQAIRPFYADTVSPYFAKMSASWVEIEADKRAYFDRFPQIRYTLVGEPQKSALASGDRVVDFTLTYFEVRKDGRNFTGYSHDRMTVREIDRSPKIVSIEERKVH